MQEAVRRCGVFPSLIDSSSSCKLWSVCLTSYELSNLGRKWVRHERGGNYFTRRFRSWFDTRWVTFLMPNSLSNSGKEKIHFGLRIHSSQNNFRRFSPSLNNLHQSCLCYFSFSFVDPE